MHAINIQLLLSNTKVPGVVKSGGKLHSFQQSLGASIHCHHLRILCTATFEAWI
jgi:hypothetical protein